MKFEEYLSSLRNKTVAVIGIGVSNRPLIELLLSRGVAGPVRAESPVRLLLFHGQCARI